VSLGGTNFAFVRGSVFLFIILKGYNLCFPLLVSLEPTDIYRKLAREHQFKVSYSFPHGLVDCLIRAVPPYSYIHCVLTSIDAKRKKKVLKTLVRVGYAPSVFLVDERPSAAFFRYGFNSLKIESPDLIFLNLGLKSTSLPSQLRPIPNPRFEAQSNTCAASQQCWSWGTLQRALTVAHS
jgi:hypothetical protein